MCFIASAGGRGFKSDKKQIFFWHQTPLNWIIVESGLGFQGLDQESWKSLHPDGVHQKYIWRIPGVYQDSLMVHNGCYLKIGPD